MVQASPDATLAPAVPGAAGASSALTLAVGEAPLRGRSSGPSGPGLDLHEELSTPTGEIPSLDGRFPDPRRGTGCSRWPEHLWLVSSHGERVAGRCRSTNQCGYCATLAAVENTEMLALDAMQGNSPQVWCVLTTRTATVDMSLFYLAREKLVKALRRRWPGCEYASLLEFTTGYGPRSGGRRRPHWNLLLKGVPVEAIDQVRELVDRIWCARVDALPSGQHVGEISEAGGLMRYIALHFQKESQAPPSRFRGQRFNCSKRYFDGLTRAEAREDAKESLWFKRQLHRIERTTGLTGDDAEDQLERELAAEGLPEWRLHSDKPPLSVPVDGPAPVPGRVLLAALVDTFDADVEVIDAPSPTLESAHLDRSP